MPLVNACFIYMNCTGGHRTRSWLRGYPLGGDSLSITKGIVSRVVMTRYAHASNKLLGIQIDAAINPGNSGGPAFSDLQEARSMMF